MEVQTSACYIIFFYFFEENSANPLEPLYIYLTGSLAVDLVSESGHRPHILFFPLGKGQYTEFRR